MVHLGIGHFGIGYKDGVNMVVARNVQGLLKFDPEMKITLFGKVSEHAHELLAPIPESLEYLNIDEFDPDYPVPGLKNRSIADQSIQDYVWHGTNITETLIDKLNDMDIVIVENLGIGIHPAVTYAFFLYVQYCANHCPGRRFFFRTHDFPQQRAKNFENLKKFHSVHRRLVPDWHEVVYPNRPNLGYITINTSDIERLIEHGINRQQIEYVPNSIDDSLVIKDDEHINLRRRIIEGEHVDPDVKFILYPVRCIPRKNVEEAIFLTQLINSLAERRMSVGGYEAKGHYHLLVTIRPDHGADKAYADTINDFCRTNNLPVTIGIQKYLAFDREYDPDTGALTRYSLGDAYNMSEVVITTSYLEGFGFAFIEPWYLGKAVIGRNIPFIRPDFQRAGMYLDHLYNVFRINGEDFRSIGYKDAEDIGLQRRLAEILKLQDRDYLEKVVDTNELSIMASLFFLVSERRKKIIVERNREIVEKTYSRDGIAKRLYRTITEMNLEPQDEIF